MQRLKNNKMYKSIIKTLILPTMVLLPTAAFSLESLDDSELAKVTGQDGVTINITQSQPLNFNVYIEDTDGLGDRLDDGNGFAVRNVEQHFPDFAAADELVKAGLVTIRGLVLDTGSTGINLDIDVGSSQGVGTESGVLHIGVDIPHLVINENSTFAIGVAGIEVANDTEVRSAASGWQRVEAALDDTNGDPVTDVITIGDIVIENYRLSFELGPEAEYFIAVDENSQPFSYTAENYAFSDASGTGALTVGEIRVNNFDLRGAKAAIVDDGLRINFAPGYSKDFDIQLSDVGFGQPSSLGDFEINGLDFGGASLTISGK